MAGDKDTNVRDFNALDADVQKLIKEALEARKYAHIPVSNFAVGAALLSDKGAIFRGCNVETSTLTPSICAERTAVFKGISEGHTRFTTVAVIGDQKYSFTTPCGVCRQVLSEFCSPETDVYVAKPDLKKVLHQTLSELLPLAFVSYKIDNGNGEM